MLCGRQATDLLKDGALTSEELAAASETNPSSLYRLLRCLATVGLMTEGPERRFSLTELGATLRSDAPGPMRPCTGQAAFDHVHGKPFFDYLGDHPEASRIFDEAMTSLTGLVVTVSSRPMTSRGFSESSMWQAGEDPFSRQSWRRTRAPTNKCLHLGLICASLHPWARWHR